MVRCNPLSRRAVIQLLDSLAVRYDADSRPVILIALCCHLIPVAPSG